MPGLDDRLTCFAAVKAVTAAQLAMAGGGEHTVSCVSLRESGYPALTP